MEEHRLALTPGYQIEHFRIESILGKGGFGITYVAVDLQLGKKVAIKELLPDSIVTRIEGSTVVPHSESQRDSWAWARERFLDEARVLAGFSHPSIVGVHRLIEANGTVYMVMDYVDGESYETRLRRIGREPNQAALMAVVGPLLDGLSEVHAKGLLHRDIKPENILINQRGQPVLIDFGSARMAVGATMTMTSIVTHGYSPAEQYQTKGKMGPWTDIYALGAVMCRAITGEKPPVAADRLMEDDFLWLSHRGLAGFDESFLVAVDWALRVRPEERPQHIDDWEPHLFSKSGNTLPGELTTIVESDPLPPDHVSDTSVRQTALPQKFNARPLITAAIIVIALSGVIFSAIYVIQSKKSERRAIAARIEAEQKVTEQQRLASEAAKIAADRAAVDKAAADKAAADKAAADKAAADKAAAERIAREAEAAKDKGVLKNLAQAAAQLDLGLIYVDGEGLINDPVKAAKWYRKAAEQESADAQFKLGLMYANGKGVAKDSAAAVKWFRKAAEQGEAAAQYALGLMYVAGEGIARDQAKGMELIRKAAAQRNSKARDWLRENGY